MNLAAIHHEATQEYCFCMEPGKFLFRLQTFSNAPAPKMTLPITMEIIRLKCLSEI